MNRRDAILGTLALVSARGALAQRPALVCIQTTGELEEAKLSVERFTEGMRELGQAEGRTFRLETRHWNGDPAAVAPMVRELLAMQPDVLVLSGLTVVQTAKKATGSIPIVVASGSDLVSAAVVRSYARPGGNVTGLTGLADVLTAKRLEILAEALPNVRKVVLLQNPAYPLADAVQSRAQKTATRLRIELISVDAGNPSQLDAAIATLGQTGATAVLVVPHALFAAQASTLIKGAMRQKIAVVHWRPEAAEQGALLVQGLDGPQQYKRAAAYVNRILKGARPADLPIEQVTHSQLIVNLRTAKALEISVPQSVLLRAHRVIE